MAAPTNLTALTAIDLGTLPATTTQIVHDAGTTYEVWYKYTAEATVTWISAWATGAPGVAYLPTLSLWLGPASAPVHYHHIASYPNLPVQAEVTPATTYYLKITPNGGNPTPAVLELSVLRGPRYTVPVGAIAVNDDSENFPVVFIDIATGDPISALPFPAGEAADTLPSGVVLAANAWDVELSVHDATGAVIGTLPYDGAAEAAGFVRAHAATSTFFVGDRATGDVRTVSSAAVFGSTTFSTGADVTALAANLDATLLLIADATLHTIEQWNLTTNSAAGSFIADPAGYHSIDILVLTNDTILVNYAKTGSAEQRVVHYDASATVLHTYDFTEPDLVRPAGTIARIATSLDDPTSFWIWTHHDGGISKFREIRIVDGATIQTVETVEFTGGASTAADGSEVRFGHSFSCTFWIVRQPNPTPPDGPPPGVPTPPEDELPPFVPPTTTTDVRYVRRLRRAPHVSNDQKRVFLRTFELDLERGQGLVTGQGSDPMVLLRISRDGGQTWGEEQRLPAGKLGAYQQRVIARRLGQARDTVFEVVVSDPIAWSLVGAWLDVEPGVH